VEHIRGMVTTLRERANSAVLSSRELSEKVKALTQHADKTSSEILHIIEQVKSMSQMTESLAATSEELSATVAEVKNGTDVITREVESMAQDAVSVSEIINRQKEELQKVVNESDEVYAAAGRLAEEAELYKL